MRLQTATIERLRDALLHSGRRPSIVPSSAYETLTREGLLTPEEVGSIHLVGPLAETMFLMMAADGVLADVEQDAVRGAIRTLTNDVLRTGTINVMLEGYAKRLADSGREARSRRSPRKLRKIPIRRKARLRSRPPSPSPTTTCAMRKMSSSIGSRSGSASARTARRRSWISSRTSESWPS